MGTVDERIDQLLNKLDGINNSYYVKLYEEGSIYAPDWSDVKAQLIIPVKQFIKDMGESVVKVQAIDEFVEYAGHGYIDDIHHLEQAANDYKKQQGYE